MESGSWKTDVNALGDGKEDGEVAGRDGGLVEDTEEDERASDGKELGGGSGGNGGTGGRGDDVEEADGAKFEDRVIEDTDDLDGAGRGDRPSDSSSVAMRSESDASRPSTACPGGVPLVSSADAGNDGTATGSAGIDRLSFLSFFRVENHFPPGPTSLSLSFPFNDLECVKGDPSIVQGTGGTSSFIFPSPSSVL